MVLTACGGGGGTANSSGSSGSSSGSSGGSSGGSTAAATLAGVVAAGAPMLGATLTVVDASGANVGTGTVNLADGSYTLTLSSTSPVAPLLVQASGVDMGGSPQLLYTVVPSVTAGARSVANINNLSTAVVALLLGDVPRTQFLGASSLHSGWTLLANAAARTAAQTWVKNVVKANLADAKLTDLTKVDFMTDGSFQANKTGLDIALDSVRVRFTTDLSGKALMQISNRLIVPGASEVSVDLAAAKTGLAATTPAITNSLVVKSTLTATTGNTAIMPYLAGLDTVGATVNAAIAAHSSQTEIAALGMFNSSFTYQDGPDAYTLSGTLAGWGNAGYQLSRWQVLGCLDSTLGTKGCTKIDAAALVRDGSGNVVNSLRMVVTYATATGWTWLGNGRQTPWAIYPVTWATWTSAGALDTGVTPNPGQGVQVVIASTAFMSATLQLPNGYARPFYYCNTTALCATGSGTTGVLTGDLITDQVLGSTMAGWVGTSDASPGARYHITTLTLVAGNEDNYTYLTTDMPSMSDTTAYPMPDGLSASAPLTIADFTAGLTVNWSTWAALNPDKRVVEVRAVITCTSSAPVIQTVAVGPLAARSVSLSSFSSVPSDAVGYTLWMVAQDDQGRRYISKIAAS